MLLLFISYHLSSADVFLLLYEYLGIIISLAGLHKRMMLNRQNNCNRKGERWKRLKVHQSAAANHNIDETRRGKENDDNDNDDEEQALNTLYLYSNNSNNDDTSTNRRTSKSKKFSNACIVQFIYIIQQSHDIWISIIIFIHTKKTMTTTSTASRSKKTQ